MCGIIGVIGEDAAEKAFAGLKALEYRGYDSWGIAVPDNGHLKLERHVVKIGAARLGIGLGAKIALGHTRWATHGKVLEKNAHPHLSMDGLTAIVHNGIVENYSGLKAGLSAKGFEFNSDTDSEVIANLIQNNLSKGKAFVDAVRFSLLSIEGYYAIAALHAGESKIVCARNGSPLVLGIGKELFVASDATAFLEHTKKAVYLDDMAMAVLEGGNFQLMSVDSGNEIKPNIIDIQWSIEQAKKGL